MRQALRSVRSENGSGSVLALGILAVAVGMFALLQLLAVTLHQNRINEVAVDTAAIAAADSLRGLSTGYPCEVAERIAHINGANLTACRIVGFEVSLRVQSETLGIVLSATARAGPS